MIDLLFIGSARDSTQSSWQRFQSLRALGLAVDLLDLTEVCNRGIRPIAHRLGLPVYRAATLREANAALLARVVAAQPKVAWIEKGLFVQPETLGELKRLAPRTRLVSYQDDNPFGSRRGERSLWRDFVRCIPGYDLHFVKRESDLAEFARRGAKRARVALVGFYAPAFPQEAGGPPSRYLHEVCFSGTMMEQRGAAAWMLLVRHKIDLHVYGNRWNRHPLHYLKPAQFHRPLPLEGRPGYVDVIRRSRINLGFVSKSNGDEYTGRSLEIPAAGGFLLAERTSVHAALYREGIEAEFFSNLGELADKCRYYLANESRRLAVAAAGCARAQGDDYSWTRRMREAWMAIAADNEIGSRP